VFIVIPQVAVPPEESDVENDLGNEGPLLRSGEIVAVPETIPENPLRLVMVIVAIPLEPFGIVSVVGLTERLKSGGGGGALLKTAV